MTHEKKTHIDLFSGIGGFAIAADAVWPGIRHVFCDNEPFAQAILKKHYPGSPIYGDIRSFIEDTERERRAHGTDGEKGAEIRGQRHLGAGNGDGVYLLTGGFPCQPFSIAGRRKGTTDDRYLWPEMFRVIRATLPRWVIAENVRGLATWNEGMVLERVCTDLESAGYEVGAFVIPACALGAPHRRERIWIIANAEYATEGYPELGRVEARAPVRTSRPTPWGKQWLPTASRLCTVDDGIPGGLARPRGWRNAALKAAGNAIVPQVAEEIMKAIRLADPV